jgi:glycosyltransferase involved in cell wall biosynthesis
MYTIRVAYFGSEMSDAGGAERVNFQILTQLDRGRFEPRAIFLKGTGEIGRTLIQHGVPIEVIGLRRRSGFLWAFMRVYRELNCRPVDILFTGEDRLCMAMAALLRRSKALPHYILCFHNTRLPSGVGRLIHPLAVQSADCLVMLSERNKRFWQAYYNLPDSRIRIIPNGIPLQRLAPLNSKQRQAQRQLKGLEPDKFTVGLVTFFKNFKNLPGFVQVAHAVIAAGCEAQFALVGDGPDRPRIEQALDNWNMRSHFLLPGKVPDASQWYPLFDVALMTSSSSEAFPLTLIEAMACGLPVVATDVAGIPDIVVHGETGFLASPTELDRLADYVVQLARDSELRRRMGAAGRQRALAEFDTAVMVRRYAQLFEEVVQADNRREIL